MARYITKTLKQDDKIKIRGTGSIGKIICLSRKGIDNKKYYDIDFNVYTIGIRYKVPRRIIKLIGRQLRLNIKNKRS